MTLGALLAGRARSRVAARAAGRARPRRHRRRDSRSDSRRDRVSEGRLRHSAAAARPAHQRNQTSSWRESGAPERVRDAGRRAFTAIATAEGEIHGMPPEEVHLHEVGAVDAILDVVGVIWGLELLGVERVYCGHDRARRRNGEGGARHSARAGAGDAQAARGTSGASRARGFGRARDADRRGAGSRVVVWAAAGGIRSAAQRLRRGHEGFSRSRERAARHSRRRARDDGTASRSSIELVCDIDDMSPEYLAAVADRVARGRCARRHARAGDDEAGATGHARRGAVSAGGRGAIEELLLVETTTIGVRQRSVRRRALPREMIQLTVLGHDVGAKLVTLPNGRRRAKPEFADVERVALATGRPLQDISRLAAVEAERHSEA